MAAKKLKRSPTIQIVARPESGTLGAAVLWKGYYELEGKKVAKARSADSSH